jgi:hypothetical protein
MHCAGLVNGGHECEDERGDRDEYRECRKRPAPALQRAEARLVISKVLNVVIIAGKKPIDSGPQPNELLPDVPYGHDHRTVVRVDD